MTISVEQLATFCRAKGFTYQSSELYGGLSGIYDYGPLGVELKRAILNHWWRRFVTGRDDMIGMDGAIISSAKIWDASGHTSSFNDPIVHDAKTSEQYRADHLIEDALGIATDGMTSDELQALIEKHDLTSPAGNPLTPLTSFNLMFPVSLGASQKSANHGFLRGETAQIIFANFKNITDTNRVKLPFGIAQIGKAFRNEISPRDFLFRLREFEQMEIEYFTNPNATYEWKEHFDPELLDTSVVFASRADQQNDSDGTKRTLRELVAQGALSELHAYWIGESYRWYVDLGLSEEKLRIREHLEDELSHYSSATFDIDYRYPFGYKEMYGCADRGDFDLAQHAKHSGKKLLFHDDSTSEKLLPHVIEPSFGFERAFLAMLFEAYRDDERGNAVLSLTPALAPVQAAVLPLVANKSELVETSRRIYRTLTESGLRSAYDKGGSIGRRYARQDEIGTPYCVTVDFESLEDGAVTVRDRDSTEQERVPIDTLSSWLTERCR